MAGLMSLAMVALVGCNKENNAPSADGAEATVSIKLQGAQMRAATYEPGKGEDDMKVYTLAAMVYNGENQEGYKTAEKAEDLSVNGIRCTAGKRQLVVVANFGKENLQGLTLTQLQDKVLKLSADQQNPQSMLHMMTSEVTEVDIKAGANFYGIEGEGNVVNKDPLMITHVHAGVELTNVSVNFDQAFSAKYSINLKKNTQIIGLIVKGQSKIFGQSLVFGENYLYGEQNFGETDKKYTPAEDKYKEAGYLKKSFDGEDYSQSGFYILENNALKHPTILAIKTKLLDKDGKDLTKEAIEEAKKAGYCNDKGETYYPVLVNWEKQGYTYTDAGKNKRNVIERNHKYLISLIITGPGTNEPEDPTNEPATLSVNVKVAEWLLVHQFVKW